jgi:hypothetical protein
LHSLVFVFVFVFVFLVGEDCSRVVFAFVNMSPSKQSLATTWSAPLQNSRTRHLVCLVTCVVAPYRPP